MAASRSPTAKRLSGAIDFAACVSFYYVTPHKKSDFSAIAAPVLMHWGAEGAWNGEATANALLDGMRAAGVSVTSELYPDCGHAFFNRADRLGTFDQATADLSPQRTLSFCDANLG